MHPALARLLGICASLPLAACVLVPRTTEAYDADCRITTRHMDLQPVQLATLWGCRDQECAVLLAAAGATAAASAIISGSIVIVGNAAYWFEKQGRCQRERPPAPPPPPATEAGS
jgi:hypothetical protein